MTRTQAGRSGQERNAPDGAARTAVAAARPPAERSAGPSGRSAVPLRTRLVRALVLLTVLALAVTSLTDYLVDRAGYHDHVDGALERSYTQIRELAENGVDPLTGDPFADADALVRLALQRAVPEPGQGFLGIVGDAVRWQAPATVELRLEQDPQLVARALEMAGPGRQAARTDLRTQTRHYRMLVVPVSAGAGERGAVVVAFDLSTAHAQLLRQRLGSAAIGAGVLALAGVLLWRGAGRILLPLAAARRTAEEITGTDLSRRIPVRGDDDLAALLGTFNGMLDRLEEAFAGQRRLLDDVSHELRTPLTIVRGHLELMDASDPADATETRGLVLEELDRMGRLVGDLMILAESDRPDFVRRRPTDLGELLHRVLDKARPLGERAWRVEGRPEAVVSIDPQRITQALLQLAGNAVEHSEAGSLVAFGAEIDEAGGAVRVWVRDEGRGVPAAEQSRIFQRFARAGAEGADRAPSGAGLGLGIGLSIVAGIAAAHAGRVELDSAPGRGSRFTIVLPEAAEGTTERSQRA
ncbi:MAG: ATP-binding protein [Pseudoclavibacter sp.]|nr:ATP-binding protein [Pseudoclavibacter sp.]